MYEKEIGKKHSLIITKSILILTQSRGVHFLIHLQGLIYD